MFYKKAEGLTFTVLIIAIIGLVVFLVVIVIFSQNSGKAVKTIEQCISRGGTCRSTACNPGEFQLPNVECTSTEPLCCLKLQT